MRFSIFWTVPHNLEQFPLRLHRPALAPMNKCKVIVRGHKRRLRRDSPAVRIGSFHEHIILFRYPPGKIPRIGILGIELEQPAHRLSRYATVSMRFIQQRETAESVAGGRVGWQDGLLG